MLPTYSDLVDERIARFGFPDALSEKIRNSSRCFVVGTGPSLAKIDLEAFSDELVIGVNFAMRAGCKPDIVCVSDPSRVDTDNLGPGRPPLVTVKHVYNRHKEFLKTTSVYHDIQFVDAGPKTHHAANTPLDPRFGKIYWASSVVAELAVPFATYVGIPNVYVLGLDGASASWPANYVGGQVEKFIGPPDTTLFHLHECIANQVKALGTNVYNASPGGIVEAFPKIDLHDVKPEAVRKAWATDITGKLIVLKGTLYRVVSDNGAYRLVDRSGAKFLRHKASKIVAEKDDGTEHFRADSSWLPEPSFVNREWISLRSVNMANHYMVSPNGVGTYRLWKFKNVFSPYFSSFRLFDSAEQAASRIETDKIYLAVENIKGLVGSLMIRNDRLSF